MPAVVETEQEKAQDRSFWPYQNLAAAVIESALVDFGVRALGRRGRGRPKERRDRTQEGRLSTLRLQIRAGAFLVERTDEVTLMWFNLSGVDIAVMRAQKPEWPFRLKTLRSRLEFAEEKWRRALRQQLAINREVGRGERTENNRSVGRLVKQPRAVQGRDLREADRLVAGSVQREADVLRRTWSPAAYVDRRANWARSGPYGRLVGALGDLPWFGTVPQRAGEGTRLGC